MTDQNAQDIAVEHKNTLNAFSRALTREAHVLTQHPDLLWQQLYNRLQWEENEVKEVIAPELTQRSGSGARPWLQVNTPHRESEALIRILEGHTSYVEACAFSPDGCTIVSTSNDKTLQVWNAATGQALRTLKGHTSRVNACAFSPDGCTIVSASQDKTLREWDAATGHALRTLLGHTDWVMACAFSPDGCTIVSASYDNTLRVWNAETGRLLRILEGHTDFVNGCAFSPDGNTIVSASSDNTLRVWNAETGRLLRILEGHTDFVNGCAFSPDGNTIVSASSDNTLWVWETASGRPLRTLEGHTDTVWACAFSPDGCTIVSASRDRTLLVWDTATGQVLRTLKGHTSRVWACAFSPDGCTIVSASRDKTLRMWNAATRQALRTSEGHTREVPACAFSPDGRFIASGSWDKTLRVWDAVTGCPLHTLEGHTEWVNACAFSPDGRLIISASDDKTLRMWKTETGRPLRTLEGHADRIWACAFSPDGCTIVSASRDKTLRVWDAASGQALRTLKGHKLFVEACAFSPDGRLIVSASQDKTLRMWDTASGQALRTLEGHTYYVMSCAFSPDGHTIVSASWDKTLRLWDAATGRSLRTLEGHTDYVWSCAFSPDGRLIVSASQDKTLRVWDAATGNLLGRLPLPGALRSLGLHPWAPQMVCGDEGGAVYRLESVGFEYGPIIVTAAEDKKGVKVFCPTCQQEHSVTRNQLGKEFTCPTSSCGLRLRLNPFVVKQPEKAAPTAKRTAKVPAGPRTTISRKLTGYAPKKIMVKRQLGPLSLTNKGLLICGYDDGSFGIWGSDADKPDSIESIHQTSITAIAISSGGATTVFGARDGMLQIWDLNKRTMVTKVQFPAEITALAVGSDSRVVVGFADGSLGVWNGIGDPFYLSGHDDRVTAVAILPNEHIVSGSMDLRVRYWNPDTRKPLESFKGLKTYITMIAAAAADNRLVGGCEEAGVFSWEPGKGTPPIYNTVKIKGSPSQVIAAAVGSHPLVLCGGADGIARVINLELKKIILKREFGIPIIAGALAPDGSQGVVCDEQGRVYRFKAEG